jgi:hypothetical protein
MNGRYTVVAVLIVAVAVVAIFAMLTFGDREAKQVPVPGPTVVVTETPAPGPTVTVTPVPTPTVTVTVTPKPTPTLTIVPSDDYKAVSDLAYNFVAVRGVGNVEGLLSFMTSGMRKAWAQGDLVYYSDGYKVKVKAVEGKYATVDLSYRIVRVEWSNGDYENKVFTLQNVLYFVKYNSRWLIATPSQVDCIVYTH